MEFTLPVKGKPTRAGRFAICYQGLWHESDRSPAGFPWRDDIEWHIDLDRISPQPVPEEVVEAARWLQGWTADCCILGTEGLRHLRTICDHILPAPEPLPLPEQRRGVVYGYPCVASKSVDDDTWWVQWVDRDGNNQNQFFSEKCRDLKLGGAADA